MGPCEGAKGPGTVQAVAVDGGFHLGYRRWLDGLRGAAILMVLAFHFHLLPGGSLGVDVFFVLSGFLITSLLAEEWQRRASISLKSFYLRRSCASGPLLGRCSPFRALSALWLPRPQATASLREVVVAGCYVANWATLRKTIGMPRLGFTWSLSVEEQFYLLWPPLLAGMLWMGLSRRRILQVVCGGIFASAVLRIVLYSLHRTAERGPEKMAAIMRMYIGLDTRADALLVGCLTALIVVWGLLPRSQCFVRWIGAVSHFSAAALAYLAVNRCLDHSQYYNGLFTGVALMVAAIIVRLLSAPSRVGAAVLESSPLVGVGRISYGLYLYHIPIVYWLDLDRRLGWQHPWYTLLAAGLTLLAALVSFVCIERPCLRLKDRLHMKLAPAARPGGAGPHLSARAA